MTIEHAHSTNGRVAHGEPSGETATPATVGDARRTSLRRFVAPLILALAAFFVLRRLQTRPDLG